MSFGCDKNVGWLESAMNDVHRVKVLHSCRHFVGQPCPQHVGNALYVLHDVAIVVKWVDDVRRLDRLVRHPKNLQDMGVLQVERLLHGVREWLPESVGIKLPDGYMVSFKGAPVGRG